MSFHRGQRPFGRSRINGYQVIVMKINTPGANFPQQVHEFHW